MSRINVAMTVEQLWQPVPGGSGTYIRELAGALSTDPSLSLVGLAAHTRARNLYAQGEVGVGMMRRSGTDERFFGGHGLPDSMFIRRSMLLRLAMYEAWSRLRFLPWRGFGADVIHATTWAIPPKTAPLVVTIQDLAFRRSPEHFTARGVSFFERALTIARNEADFIVVPSQATFDDCIVAGLPEEKLRLIPLGVRQPELSAAAAADFRARRGLAGDFILWVGTVEPRKNIPGLIEAYRRMVAAGSELDLVLAGPDGWGEADAEIERLERQLPEGRIHHLGLLPPDELAQAYAAARVFCFPSLWEGFGLPVLEAQAHGTPVVTSRGTSMAEIGGEAALLADPTDPDEIASALTQAAGPARVALSAAAKANAAKYSWQRCAANHAEVYREAAMRQVSAA